MYLFSKAAAKVRVFFLFTNFFQKIFYFFFELVVCDVKELVVLMITCLYLFSKADAKVIMNF